MLSRSATKIEMVDFHRAVEHVLARHHEAQRMTDPPGRRLANPMQPSSLRMTMTGLTKGVLLNVSSNGNQRAPSPLPTRPHLI